VILSDFLPQIGGSVCRLWAGSGVQTGAEFWLNLSVQPQDITVILFCFLLTINTQIQSQYIYILQSQ